MERSQVTTLMVFLLFFVSCGQNKNTQSDKQDSMQENSIENDIRVNTALLFINSYIEQGVTVE